MGATDKIEMYKKIVDRAIEMRIKLNDDIIGAIMDIESADKVFNLDLEKFLHFENFDFVHDFCGIQKNIVRTEYSTRDFSSRFGFFKSNFGLFTPNFIPRCAVKY